MYYLLVICTFNHRVLLVNPPKRLPLLEKAQLLNKRNSLFVISLPLSLCVPLSFLCLIFLSHTFVSLKQSILLLKYMYTVLLVLRRLLSLRLQLRVVRQLPQPHPPLHLPQQLVVQQLLSQQVEKVAVR